MDRPLLDVRYQFTLPFYTPVKTYQPPAIGKHAVPALVPGQNWIAFSTLDQDVLILHLPEDACLRPKAAVGLAIHRDGRLYASRPWFDMQRQEKIVQPPWQPPIWRLFALKGEYVLDCFKSDLVYRGLEGDQLLFETRDFKCMSAAPLSIQPIHVPSAKDATLPFHRLRVNIQPSQGRHGAYTVDETAPGNAVEGSGD
jgi:hypothetical protein